MTQPPAGGPGTPDGEATRWRAPEEADVPRQWGQLPPPSWGAPPSGQPPSWGPPSRPPAGIVPLRPLTVGEILDGSFQAVRSNARTMVGTAAAVVAAVTVVSLAPQALLLDRLKDNPYFTQGPQAPLADQLDALTGIGESRAVPSVLTFVAVTMLEALLIVPVSEAVLGRRMDAGQMWRRARGRLPAALGLALLTGLLTAAAAVLALAPGIAALLAGSLLDNEVFGVALLLAGVAGAVVLAIALYVRWSLAAPALILESAPVTTAMRRSWRLVNGSAWRVLGILLLAGIIVSIGQAVITVPVGLLAGLPAAGQPSQYASLPVTFAQLLISGVGTIVAGAVFYPFSAAVSALLYIDLRMRREGLDVRLARAAAEGGAQAEPA
jgi:Membrane domain of glycerophosphoryl diester phosphodiesterase